MCGERSCFYSAKRLRPRRKDSSTTPGGKHARSMQPERRRPHAKREFSTAFRRRRNVYTIELNVYTLRVWQSGRCTHRGRTATADDSVPSAVDTGLEADSACF